MSALHKVLVVDDDPVVGKSFDRVLTAKGYHVITAPDAAHALERLREDEIDLVVTDIRMPGMDGLELAETVKARRPWTPVLIVTGYGTEADEARARAAGVSAFLHKPLSPEMIEGYAAEALASVQPAAAAPAEVVVEAAAPAPAKRNRIVDIALFFAAPIVGFFYAVMMPFVGMAVLGGMAVKALGRKMGNGSVATGIKTAAKMVVLPFVGLAYVIFLPFAGIATLAWFGLRRVFAGPQAE